MKEKLKSLLLVSTVPLINLFVYAIGRAFPNRATLIGTSLDLKIPYIKYFIYFYISWYIFIFLIPYLVAKYDKERFNKYLIMMYISLFITMIIYFIFPTEITRTNLDLIGSGFTDNIVKMIYKHGSVNACMPSLHVLLAMGYMIPLFKNNMIPKFIKFIGIFSSIGIILSTLFVKQHVIYDVISSIIIIIISWILVNKLNLDKKCKLL